MAEHAQKPLSDSATKSETVIWDEEVNGLDLRLRKGQERWIVQTRLNGRTRKATLGDGATLSVECQ